MRYIFILACLLLTAGRVMALEPGASEHKKGRWVVETRIDRMNDTTEASVQQFYQGATRLQAMSFFIACKASGLSMGFTSGSYLGYGNKMHEFKYRLDNGPVKSDSWLRQTSHLIAWEANSGWGPRPFKKFLNKLRNAKTFSVQFSSAQYKLQAEFDLSELDKLLKSDSFGECL